MEALTLSPKTLDEQGRCCGRKPIFYKTRRGMGSQRDPHHFCCRCCAEYDVEGRQRGNWAYLKAENGFVPKYPDQEYWRSGEAPA